jgi:hypothetical protein
MGQRKSGAHWRPGHTTLRAEALHQQATHYAAADGHGPGATPLVASASDGAVTLSRYETA